jgi:signal transduction histidine kinase
MSDEHFSRFALYKAFPGIPDNEIKRLIDAGNVARYPPETILCLEGQVEYVFYILLDGEVKVTKEITGDDVRVLKHLNPGDFFGEMGLIHDAPRAATVTTTKSASVLEINKEGFEEVLNLSSVVSLSMVREVSRRLMENDEMAIEDLRHKAGELALAYQQLAELDLARREFLTTIAHELRTPLTSASGFMQVIQMGMMEGDALKQALEKVSRNIGQIVSLINDILFLQEMELILSDFEPVDVGELVARVVDAEKGHAEEMGVGLDFNIAPNLPPAPGDLKSLERTLKAILNNAIKFSIYQGNVHVKVDHNPSYVWVSIRDQGIGISEEDLPNIFNRFWRTEEFDGQLFGGVGLGLSIARQVIQQHGGEIEVKSEVRKGSTFTVRLKLKSSPSPII